MMKMLQKQQAIIDKYLIDHDIENTLDTIINDVVTNLPSNPLKSISTLLDVKVFSQIKDVKLCPAILENGVFGISCSISTNIAVYTSTISIQSETFSLNKQHYHKSQEKLHSILIDMNPIDLSKLITSINDDSDLDEDIKLVSTQACFKTCAGHKCEPLYKTIATYFNTLEHANIPKLSIGLVDVITPINSLTQSINLVTELNPATLPSVLEISRQLQIKLTFKAETEKTISVIKSSQFGKPLIQLPLGKDEITYPKAAAAKPEKGKKGAPAPAAADVTALPPTITSSPSLIKYWLQIVNESLEAEKATDNSTSLDSLQISLDMHNTKSTFVSNGFKSDAEMTIYFNDLTLTFPRLTHIANPIQLPSLASPLPQVLASLLEVCLGPYLLSVCLSHSYMLLPSYVRQVAVIVEP